MTQHYKGNWEICFVFQKTSEKVVENVFGEANWISRVCIEFYRDMKDVSSTSRERTQICKFYLG